jgi:hypothetical protein
MSAVAPSLQMVRQQSASVSLVHWQAPANGSLVVRDWAAAVLSRYSAVAGLPIHQQPGRQSTPRAQRRGSKQVRLPDAATTPRAAA